VALKLLPADSGLDRDLRALYCCSVLGVVSGAALTFPRVAGDSPKCPRLASR